MNNNNNNNNEDELWNLNYEKRRIIQGRAINLGSFCVIYPHYIGLY